MKPRTGSSEILEEAAESANRAFLDASPLPLNYGIGGNTFRAFRSSGMQPSVFYRSWVTDVALHILGRTSTPSTRDEFIALHAELSVSLAGLWRQRSVRAIKVSEKYKIVDLFIKALAFSKGHEFLHLRQPFFEFGNVPLDRFSLLLVGKLFCGVILSKNPSMGDITDEETYWSVQEEIFCLTSKAGVPNLAIDHFAWNANH
jgi:hypothetical protein